MAPVFVPAAPVAPLAGLQEHCDAAAVQVCGSGSEDDDGLDLATLPTRAMKPGAAVRIEPVDKQVRAHVQVPSQAPALVANGVLLVAAAPFPAALPGGPSAREEVGSEEDPGAAVDDEVMGNVEFLRAHVLPKTVGREQLFFDHLQAFAVSGMVIHDRLFSLSDVHQAFAGFGFSSRCARDTG